MILLFRWEKDDDDVIPDGRWMTMLFWYGRRMMLFRWEKDDCYSGGRRMMMLFHGGRRMMMLFRWEKDDDVIPVGEG